jgi:hypothetical protein
LRIIRQRFRVVEDRQFRASNRHYLVFQPREGWTARESEGIEEPPT